MHEALSLVSTFMNFLMFFTWFKIFYYYFLLNSFCFQLQVRIRIRVGKNGAPESGLRRANKEGYKHSSCRVTVAVTLRRSSFRDLTRLLRSETTAVERFSAITSCWPIIKYYYIKNINPNTVIDSTGHTKQLQPKIEIW